MFLAARHASNSPIDYCDRIHDSRKQLPSGESLQPNVYMIHSSYLDRSQKTRCRYQKLLMVQT